MDDLINLIDENGGSGMDQGQEELTLTNPVDEIMAYILETPENTNPNVLRGILEKYFNQNNEEDLDDKPGIVEDDNSEK